MQSFTAGTSNTLMVDVVNTSGDPITSGTVNAYLRALSGDNAKKWWNAATASWSAVVVSAGEMSHIDDGHWEVDIVAAAWVAGTRYRLYWKESDNLHIPASEDVLEVAAPNVSFEATVTD